LLLLIILFISFTDKLIGVEGARLLENENHIFFVRCNAVEAFLVLRDERSGETTQRRKAARGLTARPAKSEATWNGNQLLTRATKFAKTAFSF
jgi:hypothetical protein